MGRVLSMMLLPAIVAALPEDQVQIQVGEVANRTVTRIAFGSCNKASKPNHFWDRIVSRNPDIWAWLGDIVYADTAVLLKWRIPGDPAAVRAQFELQSKSEGYRTLQSNVPIVGVWDDHDMGTNDGDVTVDHEWKKGSQRALMDFLQEPIDSPRRRREGVYASYVLGAEHRRVHLLLLDNRYHRDPYERSWFGTPMDAVQPHQDMLGREQWAWLEDQLATTQAEVTVIGAGLQIISRGDPWVAESWSKLPQSQAKLYSLLAKYNKTRAFFISGDVHISELHRVTCDAVGYPLHDLTSSGMTHSWGGPIKRLVVGACLMGHTRVHESTAKAWNGWYNGKNWGELDIDWGDGVHARHDSRTGSLGDWETARMTDQMTTRAAGSDDDDAGQLASHSQSAEEMLDRHGSITFRVWGEDDTVVMQHTVPVSHLKPAVEASAAMRAAVEACVSAPLDQGLSPSCSAVLSSCSPSIQLKDSAWYFVGHAFVISGMLVVLLAAALGPVLLFVSIRRAQKEAAALRGDGKPSPAGLMSLLAAPGGAPTAIAVMVACYAAAWQFIETLH